MLNLFVLHRLDPHPLGTGKSLYLCDVALAGVLGASFDRLLYTWLVQEQLSQRSYRQDLDHQLFFYRTTKGSLIHLIVESRTARTGTSRSMAAFKLFSEERLDLRELEVLWAFKKKVLAQSQSSRASQLGAARDVELLGLGPKEFSIPARYPELERGWCRDLSMGVHMLGPGADRP